ncbi:GNAT family N-acetyltransferase [Evansella sp. LMS18]|uniref:GNAT family N-acetyltransferase n=1 Tax=Evansella sp. LMS18 TaxID=2924033 RepID=UPI0020D114D5|nr:GNAT family protein [Evansella sp. LMS18]UTR09519.1 GNAT family N-acetyltransferase [Evansella sp. LMS18]
MNNTARTFERLVMNITAKDGSNVILRPVREEDASDIITAADDVIRGGRFIQKERARTLEEEQAFIREMAEKDNMYAGVVIDNKVKGIARLVRGELKMKRHTALFRTWLGKEAQGKGLGNAVMEYTLHWGKIHGLHKINLTVFASNKVAVKLYEKHGFITEGVQKEQAFINGEYDDEVFMAYFYNNLADKH